MKNEWVCSGFDLGLVGVENEEQRGLFFGFDLGLLIQRMKNEGRKGRTTKQEKEEQWVNIKEIECIKLDFHYQHIDLESLRLDLLQ